MSHSPVDPRDFPDPFVLSTEAGFYAYATNGGGSNVQVMTSPDLLTWDGAPDALPVLAGWAQAGNTWAPVVLPWNGAYVMFYACREPNAGRQAISVATSDHPGGPFTDTSSEPLVYQLDLGGSIDPSPYLDVDGSAYLVWKADSNAINQPSTIWLQPVGPDGTTLTGAPIELLRYDAPWENPLIEAPSIARAGGTYFLFYSANWWNTDRYSIGYATATAVGGPYTKTTTSKAWFASDAEVAGPGGQEWFTDTTGQQRMAYHGWTPGHVGYPGGARSLRLATVDLTGPAPVTT
jgi:beta-xylosidase